MLLEKVQTSRFGDGSFDIRGGGGLVFFLATSSFYFHFVQQVMFFKRNLKQIFGKLYMYLEIRKYEKIE